MAELPADLDGLLKLIDEAPDWEREIDMNCDITEVTVDLKGPVTCKHTIWEIVLTKVGRDGSEAEDTRAEALARLFTVVDRKTLRDLVVALRAVKAALGVFDQQPAIAVPAAISVLVSDLHKVFSP